MFLKKQLSSDGKLGAEEFSLSEIVALSKKYSQILSSNQTVPNLKNIEAKIIKSISIIITQRERGLEDRIHDIYQILEPLTNKALLTEESLSSFYLLDNAPIVETSLGNILKMINSLTENKVSLQELVDLVNKFLSAGDITRAKDLHAFEDYIPEVIMEIGKKRNNDQPADINSIASDLITRLRGNYIEELIAIESSKYEDFPQLKQRILKVGNSIIKELESRNISYSAVNTNNTISQLMAKVLGISFEQYQSMVATIKETIKESYFSEESQTGEQESSVNEQQKSEETIINYNVFLWQNKNNDIKSAISPENIRSWIIENSQREKNFKQLNEKLNDQLELLKPKLPASLIKRLQVIKSGALNFLAQQRKDPARVDPKKMTDLLIARSLKIDISELNNIYQRIKNDFHRSEEKNTLIEVDEDGNSVELPIEEKIEEAKYFMIKMLWSLSRNYSIDQETLDEYFDIIAAKFNIRN